MIIGNRLIVSTARRLTVYPSSSYRPLLLLIFSMLFYSCNKPIGLPSVTPADSLRIVADNIEHRKETEKFFIHHPDSPFNRDSAVQYHGIKWFPIDPLYTGMSVLHRYENPDTVVVLGTKGEERKQLRYGYFEFPVPDEFGNPSLLKINVYKFTPHDAKRYALYKNNLSIRFTDKTTGKETYEVGRYLEIGEGHPDPSYVYTIDLNKTFNPYCAYSDLFSCAIPRKEDHLDIALRVGQLKYLE